MTAAASASPLSSAFWVLMSMESWMLRPGTGARELMYSRPWGSPAASTSTTARPGVPVRNSSYCCSMPPFPTTSSPW